MPAGGWRTAPDGWTAGQARSGRSCWQPPVGVGQPAAAGLGAAAFRNLAGCGPTPAPACTPHAGLPCSASLIPPGWEPPGHTHSPAGALCSEREGSGRLQGEPGAQHWPSSAPSRGAPAQVRGVVSQARAGQASPGSRGGRCTCKGPLQPRCPALPSDRPFPTAWPHSSLGLLAWLAGWLWGFAVGPASPGAVCWVT